MRNVSNGAAVVSAFAYLASQLSLLSPYVEVDISQGRLRGSKSISRNGRPYIEFLGIPYAKPPLGELRFESPEPPTNWNGVRLATVYGRNCLQYEFLTHLFTGDEDCLTANVFAHQVLTENQIQQGSPLKPVIVYIFGGLFMSGFSYVYKGKYWMDEDVVVVTFNYRVNSFGFLNTGDGTIRGNMGMKDQVMVLRWVQKNIKYFGGDPNSVTIMGQSAGAASVHYHLLSPMSKGLFHRAISQSGSALQPWAFSMHPRLQAKHLGEALNCPTKNSTQLSKCLKSKNAYELARFHAEYLDPLPDPLTVYGPSKEVINDKNAFLAATPINILKNGQVASKVPWIIGATNGEGLLGAGYLLKKPKKLLSLGKDWNTYAPIIFDYKDHPNRDNISKAIMEKYFPDRKMTAASFKSIARLYSDNAMFWGIDKSVKLHSKVAPVYPYVFTYEGDSGLTNILLRMMGGLPRLVDFGIGTVRRWAEGKMCRSCIAQHGVSHADELVYQFNIPVIADEISPGSEDYEFSRAFIKLWMSFVKNGKPKDFMGIRWASTENTLENPDIKFLELDDSPEIMAEPFRNVSDFWDSLKLNE